MGWSSTQRFVTPQLLHLLQRLLHNGKPSDSADTDNGLLLADDRSNSRNGSCICISDVSYEETCVVCAAERHEVFQVLHGSELAH